MARHFMVRVLCIRSSSGRENDLLGRNGNEGADITCLTSVSTRSTTKPNRHGQYFHLRHIAENNPLTQKCTYLILHFHKIFKQKNEFIILLFRQIQFYGLVNNPQVIQVLVQTEINKTLNNQVTIGFRYSLTFCCNLSKRL